MFYIRNPTLNQKVVRSFTKNTHKEWPWTLKTSLKMNSTESFTFLPNKELVSRSLSLLWIYSLSRSCAVCSSCICQHRQLCSCGSQRLNETLRTCWDRSKCAFISSAASVGSAYPRMPSDSSGSLIRRRWSKRQRCSWITLPSQTFLLTNITFTQPAAILVIFSGFMKPPLLKISQVLLISN